MTHTSTEHPELLPCPFCGARARFEIDDECWEWVECSGCGMQGNRSASLMEDCKAKLAEAWNLRTPASQARVPLSKTHEYEEHKKYPGACRHCGYAEHEPLQHGITQEKQG